jgi:hypothetical protein
MDHFLKIPILLCRVNQMPMIAVNPTTFARSIDYPCVAKGYKT